MAAAAKLPAFVEEGAIVRLTGLERRPEYNKHYAHVVSTRDECEAPDALIRVCFVFGPHRGKYVKVRRANVAEVTGRAQDPRDRSSANELMEQISVELMKSMRVRKSSLRVLNALQRGRNDLRLLYSGEVKDVRFLCALPGCDASAGLKQCKACHSARYCSLEHQKKDWRRHKTECAAEKAARYRCVPVAPEEYDEKPPPGTECPICLCGLEAGSVAAPYPILTGCGCSRNRLTRYHVDCLLRTAAMAVGSGGKSMHAAFCSCSVCGLPFSGVAESLMQRAVHHIIKKCDLWIMKPPKSGDRWWAPLLPELLRNASSGIRVVTPTLWSGEDAVEALDGAQRWLFHTEMRPDASAVMKNEALYTWLKWVEGYSHIPSTSRTELQLVRAQVEKYIETMDELDASITALPAFHAMLAKLDLKLGAVKRAMTSVAAAVDLHEARGQTDKARRLQSEVGYKIFDCCERFRFKGDDDYLQWIELSKATKNDPMLNEVVAAMPSSVQGLDAAVKHFTRTYDTDTFPMYKEVHFWRVRHEKLMDSVRRYTEEQRMSPCKEAK